MSAMGRKRVKLIDQIRRAASECDMSHYGLAKAAGMDVAAVSRFISGTRGLSMESIDALAAVLKLRIVSDKPKARKSGGK